MNITERDVRVSLYTLDIVAIGLALYFKPNMGVSVGLFRLDWVGFLLIMFSLISFISRIFKTDSLKYSQIGELLSICLFIWLIIAGT